MSLDEYLMPKTKRVVYHHFDGVYPKISSVPAVQSSYEKMRLSGESHSIAEMLASRSSPSIDTDDTFHALLHEQKNGYVNQFTRAPHIGDFYARELIAGGGSPRGKVYLRQLASYPGDPEAWIASKEDIKRVCEKYGYTCEGDVTVKRNRDCVDTGLKEVGLDPEIVTEKTLEQIEDHPELGGTRARFDKLWGETYDRMKPWNTSEKTPPPPSFSSVEGNFSDAR